KRAQFLKARATTSTSPNESPSPTAEPKTAKHKKKTTAKPSPSETPTPTKAKHADDEESPTPSPRKRPVVKARKSHRPNESPPAKVPFLAVLAADFRRKLSLSYTVSNRRNPPCAGAAAPLAVYCRAQ